MKFNIFLAIIILSIVSSTFGQIINRIDGTEIIVDSLENKIQTLMKSVNVSGVAISVFNENKPIFSKTYGLADVQKNSPLQPSSVMYGASFAKTVFAYIAMQFVQEGVIDLDKPLVEYLDKPLPDYEIEGMERGYQDLKNDKRTKKMVLPRI